jgi:hypothetical protein
LRKKKLITRMAVVGATAVAPTVAVLVVGPAAPSEAGVCAYPPQQYGSAVVAHMNCPPTTEQIEVYMNSTWKAAGDAVYWAGGGGRHDVWGSCYGGSYFYRTHYDGWLGNFYSPVAAINC